MLEMILLATLATAPQAPCLPQSMLPVVDDTPPAVDPEPAPVVVPPQVIYRIGSLPPTWVPPSPPVYQLAPVYAPAICLPGRR